MHFLAMDRADIQHGVRECAKGMARPTKQDLEKLKRIGRYLKGHPRYLMRFAKQTDVHAINIFADSDWAGDKATRKNVSRGVLQIGNAVVKTWSSTQTVIALSSGEAELYATNKGAAQAMGLQSMLTDTGISLEIRLFTDSSTAKAIVKRTGLAKIRHIDVNELWLQQKVKDKVLTHKKIKNVYNPADLLTKPQDAAAIWGHLELMDHRLEGGRSIVAPDLNVIEDSNGLAFYLLHLAEIPCYHA